MTVGIGSGAAADTYRAGRNGLQRSREGLASDHGANLVDQSFEIASIGLAGAKL